MTNEAKHSDMVYRYNNHTNTTKLYTCAIVFQIQAKYCLLLLYKCSCYISIATNTSSMHGKHWNSNFNYMCSSLQPLLIRSSGEVYTWGGEANNIPCDLFSEHLNERLKHNMGPNLIDKAMNMQRAQSRHYIMFCRVFDEQTHIPPTITRRRMITMIWTQVVSVLLNNKILQKRSWTHTFNISKENETWMCCTCYRIQIQQMICGWCGQWRKTSNTD